MRRLTMPVLTLAFMTAVTASAGVDSNVKVPFAGVVFVPCAAGGAGEDVLLEGVLHVLATVTIDSNGGVHATLHDQPQNVRGVGLTTGDMYRGTGVTRETINIQGDDLPYEDTLVNSFKIIGEGPGNNFLVQDVLHITVDNNGNVTADIVETFIKCQ